MSVGVPVQTRALNVLTSALTPRQSIARCTTRHATMMSTGKSNPSSMYWEKASNGSHDANSVLGGFDRSTMKKLYLTRVETEFGEVPGYLAEGVDKAVAVVNARSVESSEYQTLVNPDDVFLEWVVPQGDRIPTGAVVVDVRDNGRKTFAGRGMVGGDWRPGVFVPTDQEDNVFVADGDQVVKFGPGNYEVLCVSTVTPEVK